MTHIFGLIATASEGTDQFGLDFMVAVATAEGQASSQGAQGAEAVARSRREDRSRDPLYNQMKMYSEIYRMLGWLRPLPESRLTFVTTLLGETVAFDASADRALRAGLVRESLLSIVFPNETTENVGVTSQRPFRWLLRLVALLDGVITRHEIILGLLAITDDQVSDGLHRAADRIREMREGSFKDLVAAAGEFSRDQGISLTTMENYTRFPVGVLTSPTIGWGEPHSIRGLYSGSRPVRAIRLRELGARTAARLGSMVDVRSGVLTDFSVAERAAFASLGYYVILSRAGFAEPEIAEEIDLCWTQAAPIVISLGVSDPKDILFSPFVQETDEILERASEAA